MNLRNLLENLLFHRINRSVKDHFITFIEARKIFEKSSTYIPYKHKGAGDGTQRQSLIESSRPCRKRKGDIAVPGYLDTHVLPYTACENKGQLSRQNRFRATWDHYIVLKQLRHMFVDQPPKRLRLKNGHAQQPWRNKDSCILPVGTEDPMATL